LKDANTQSYHRQTCSDRRARELDTTTPAHSSWCGIRGRNLGRLAWWPPLLKRNQQPSSSGRFPVCPPRHSRPNLRIDVAAKTWWDSVWPLRVLQRAPGVATILPSGKSGLLAVCPPCCWKSIHINREKIRVVVFALEYLP
jgi:hypothetical protein